MTEPSFICPLVSNLIHFNSPVNKKARSPNPETAPNQAPAAADPHKARAAGDSAGWEALIQATEERADKADKESAGGSAGWEALIQAAEERADKADKESADLRNELLRVRAESENYRKRTERQMESNARFAVEGFARDLLEVIDNIERALTSADEGENNVAALRGGTEMTLKILLDALRRQGIEAVDPKQEKFDPNLHEALDMVATVEQAPNTVIEVVQKGYRLRERLLRPARVRIATAPPKASGIDKNADGDIHSSPTEN